MTGSSPLSRGIPFAARLGYWLVRIIPALAGNTRSGALNREVPQDHPRSRGEYQVEALGEVDKLGSSPLSRGIPPDPAPDTVTKRIIPALAGNTPPRHPQPSAMTDHPRSRGEYTPGPCDRGTQARIIPALAGNTARSSSTPPPSTDHPRSRGEYLADWEHGGPDTGSSPLSRGIHLDPIPKSIWVGIIPALAGNTGQQIHERWCRRDHPRSRGEYARGTFYRPPQLGSSPLSRGIQPRRGGSESGEGIIPALAGNTFSRSSLFFWSWDHPRSRGEYLSPTPGALQLVGSSPLSRGIPKQIVQ